ncbi:MAG TPA: TetR/AcrR family transcriptional regulator [Polyangiaceae bacterium]|nr:TetR/AcrR family transcriptional regulator [Polyangiaceae bacterium]
MKPAQARPTPASRPRTKPANVRREELMDAAERIFLEKGIAATSVDEIVVAADVAKGTFYLHFESKDALLVALQQRFSRTFCDDLKAAMERKKPDDFTGRLRAFVDAAVTGYLERSAVHDLVFHEFRSEADREKHDNPMVVELERLLDGGTRAGVWKVELPHLEAVMLFHALHGAMDDASEPAKSLNPKRLTRAVQRFFERALGNDG